MKKGGAGGKYTWGGLLTGAEAPAPPVLDANDPNYVSEDEGELPGAGGAAMAGNGQSSAVQAYKKAVRVVKGWPARLHAGLGLCLDGSCGCRIACLRTGLQACRRLRMWLAKATQLMHATLLCMLLAGGGGDR